MIIDRLALLNLQNNVLPMLKALERSFDRPGVELSPVAREAVAALSAARLHLERILRESPFMAASLPDGAPLEPRR